jgi:hypothetical protein
MNHTTDPKARAVFADGLRALADFLSAHGDLPVPSPTSEVSVYPDGTDNAKKAEIERIARCLGVAPVGRLGLYRAARNFGPVVYQAVATPAAKLAATDAPDVLLQRIPARGGVTPVVLLVIILLGVVLVGAIVLAVVVASVRREDQRLSLKDAPASHADAAVRRFLGAGVRQAHDSAPTIEAGRR